MERTAPAVLFLAKESGPEGPLSIKDPRSR